MPFSGNYLFLSESLAGDSEGNLKIAGIEKEDESPLFCFLGLSRYYLFQAKAG